jgi:hypothetical protein
MLAMRYKTIFYVPTSSKVVADDLELHTPYLPTQRSWVKTFIYIAEAA